jgi:hypothetical protein
MKKLNIYMRRIHLYLSMALIPWFLMYGISSVVFSHSNFFDGIYGGWQPTWSVRFDKEFSYEVPKDVELREVGNEIIKQSGLPDMAFGIYQNNEKQLDIYMHNFWSSIKVRYFIDDHRLLAEDAGFRWDHFLTGMHARGGFQEESVLNDLWAVMVDLFCLSMMVWIITGIYMWWMLKGVRMWGTAAIAGGVVSFVLFLVLL